MREGEVGCGSLVAKLAGTVWPLLEDRFEAVGSSLFDQIDRGLDAKICAGAKLNDRWRVHRKFGGDPDW